MDAPGTGMVSYVGETHKYLFPPTENISLATRQLVSPCLVCFPRSVRVNTWPPFALWNPSSPSSSSSSSFWPILLWPTGVNIKSLYMWVWSVAASSYYKLIKLHNAYSSRNTSLRLPSREYCTCQLVITVGHSCFFCIPLKEGKRLFPCQMKCFL